MSTHPNVFEDDFRRIETVEAIPEYLSRNGTVTYQVQSAVTIPLGARIRFVWDSASSTHVLEVDVVK